MKQSSSIDARYECNLGKELLIKAISELNEPETNEERWQKIDQLRNSFIQKNKNLRLEREDDLYFLKFLRARNFDHNRALNMLTNYHNQLQSWPEMSKKIENPASVMHVFDAGSFVALRRKAYDVSTICIASPGKSKIQLLTDYYAALIISVNRLLDEEDIQINGITVIQDMTYMNCYVTKQYAKIAKRVYALFENALPIRLKSINIVNQPTFLNIILTIARLFPKSDKIKHNMSLLGKNYAHLRKLIDPSILPLNYGGTGLNVDERAAAWWKSIVYEDNDIST